MKTYVLQLLCYDDWWSRKFIALVSVFCTKKTIAQYNLIQWIARSYYVECGERLNLAKPKTLNEKLIWLSLFWQNPLKTYCADKVKVREYVNRKGLPVSLLPKLYNTWDDANKIQFEKLPEQYVLKCNHGCAYNIIVQDSSIIDCAAIRKQLNAWLFNPFIAAPSELHYAGINPRLILCEEYLSQGCQSANFRIVDYKLMCFNGHPDFILVCYDRDDNENAKFATFDFSWRQLFYCVGEKHSTLRKPTSINDMYQYSRILSKDFPFVRVDWYDVDSRPYLGELTFTPYGNMITYFRHDVLEQLGKKLSLPTHYSGRKI